MGCKLNFSRQQRTSSCFGETATKPTFAWFKSTSLIFTLAARKLSKKTLVARLKDLVNANDPPFAMDILADSKRAGSSALVCRVVTSASKILASLNAVNGTDSRLTDNTRAIRALNLRANLRRQKKPMLRRFLMVLRWWMFPIVFLTLCWCTFLFRVETLSALENAPRLVWFGYSETESVMPSVKSHLPNLPETRSAAFQLGSIFGELKNTPANAAPKLLQEAASILGIEDGALSMSLGSLRDVLKQLQAEEAHVGVVGRVRGLFTVVNAIWLGSILGISISIFPSIYYILKPFREFLMRVARWVLNNIMEPIARRLHEWGGFELCAWMLCSSLVLDSVRFYSPEAGVFIAATGVALALPSFAYSTLLNAAELIDRKDNTAVIRWAVRWLLGVTFSMALVYESSLFGFLAVVAFFYLMGFAVYAGPLCVFMGFEEKEFIPRCVLAAYALLTVMIGVRTSFPGYSGYVEPFRVGISVFGTQVLFIALLIISSLYYRATCLSEYLARQFAMVGTLALGLAFGEALDLEGLRNTSMVFGAVYLLTKYSELHLELNLNGWLLMLISSAIMWRISLWFHENPRMFVSLLSTAG
eukprot:jgi/Bigna1/85759/estExt_fgenesh1_pg.C_60033